MKVLLVAGDDGVPGTLADLSVTRAETMAAVRESLADCDAVVVTETAAATPEAVLAAVREGEHAAPETPVVLVGDRNGTFDQVVPADDPDALERALRVAERVATYRNAVDDLYEQSRRRADAAVDGGSRGADSERAFYDAYRRARQEFDAVRRAGETAPYEYLFGPVEASGERGDRSGGENRE